VGPAGVTPSASASGAPNTALTTTEVQIGTVQVTPSKTTSKILLIGRLDALKDAGTTVRTATVRIRRGLTNTSPQAGRDSIIRSQGVASSPYGPAVILASDSPGVTTAVDYSLRALADGASTAARFELVAVDLG
jgi:hypothetical protein